MQSERKNPAYKLLAIVFISTFIGLMWMRYTAITETMNEYTRCTENCIDWRLPIYDASILGILVGLIGLAHITHYKFLRPILATTGCLLIIIYTTDLFIYKLLHQRLNIQDVIRYAGQVKMNITVVRPELGSTHGVAILSALILGCGALVILITKAPQNIKHGLAIIAIAPILVFARQLPHEYENVASRLYEDVITYNQPDGINTSFSSNYKDRLKAKTSAKTEICSKSTQPPRSVILLVMESLSLYHSNFLSGVESYVPEIDSLAQKYSYLQSYYANGFTTDGGLIALLTGHVPLPGINRYASMDAYLGYETVKQDALKRLYRSGVQSAYFRSADQSFLATGDWLKTIGFQYIEGPEHPFYQNMPRGSFQEPGDQALYARYLQWFDKERNPGIFFSVIQTTTTHPPFIIPGSEKSGEEAAFQYADKALGTFVSELNDRAFFENGILVITGDHRSMTSLRKGEVNAIGIDAPARVPAIIVGQAFEGKGAIPGKWQHTDFLPSLLYAMGEESCTDDFTGRYLGDDPHPAKYILHAQGMERDEIMVITNQATEPFKIELDGENTDWVGSKPDDEADIVIDEINRERIRLPETERNFVPAILQAYGLLNP